MKTVLQIKQDNQDNIRLKNTPGSISRLDDANMRDDVATELRDRGNLRVDATDDLADVSRDNTSLVLVRNLGFFEPLQTDDAPDDITTFESADEGWLWTKIIDISGIQTGRTKFDVVGDDNFLLQDGLMIEKILIKPVNNDTVKIGTTIGGDEIMLAVAIPANTWQGVTMDIFTTGADRTIYFSGLTGDATIIIYTRQL